MESLTISHTDNWYEKVASRILVKILPELRGKNLLQVPLENLLDQIPSEIDLEELSALLNDDGIPAAVWKYSSLPGDSGVVIRIR